MNKGLQVLLHVKCRVALGLWTLIKEAGNPELFLIAIEYHNETDNTLKFYNNIPNGLRGME